MATVRAGSPLRAVAWHRPAKRRYIEPIERALRRLDTAVEDRRSPIRDVLETSPLFDGEGEERQRSRTRRMRSDGARNLVSLAQALLASADLATGFLGTPTGQGWDRHDWGRLDYRAYGDRVELERSYRRTQRHARTLAAMGLVSVAELKIPHGPGQWRSVTAIKRLTAEFYALVGLTAAVAQARRQRDRTKGESRVAVLKRVMGSSSNRRPTVQPAATGRAADGAYRPFDSAAPPTAPPPASGEGRPETAETAIESIRKLLGVR